jgi:hypothetical protein
MLKVATSRTRPQPNSGMPRDDEPRQTESSSADKENARPENKHRRPESENERQESAHGRNAPDARTTTMDASEGLTTCVDLVVTIEAPKTSPPSPTLKGETTLEPFHPKQRRWLAARVAAPTHLHPVFVISKNFSSRAPLVPPQHGTHHRCHGPR